MMPSEGQAIRYISIITVFDIFTRILLIKQVTCQSFIKLNATSACVYFHPDINAEFEDIHICIEFVVYIELHVSFVVNLML